MDSFMEALLSEKTGKIPDAYDWFAPLIGDWDFEYHDGYHTDALRTVKGEWIFRRVLNGAGCYDMTYTCEKYMTRLRFVQDGGKLIGTVLDDPFQKWIFSDIQAESFHWQNVTVLENGEWQVNSNVYAKRRK